MGCSPSTHSLVSGNLNAGVSYTRKTPMLKERPVHASPYHATKTLALNSCCSLKCNAFTLCIHTRAGCLGDTQNGRTNVTKCWRNDDNGNVDGWKWIAVLACNEERGNIKSKRQMSEKRRDTATVHTKTAQAECIKRYKTQKETLPTCIVSGS